MKVFVLALLGCVFAISVNCQSVSTPQLVGTVTKKYFWFLPDKTAMTQSTAAAICAKNGMKLATIKSSDEQSILNSIAVGKTLNGNQGYNFWLSASDAGHEGRWTWNNNVPVGYTNWNSNWAVTPAPNNTAVNCAYVSPTYWAGAGWFDFPCDTPSPLPLCEQTTIDFYQQGV